MALTKISRSLLDTGVSDSSDATAITIDSSENVGIACTPHFPFDVQLNSSRRIGFNYSDSQNSILSHDGSGNIETLGLRGNTILFYSDYDASNPDGVERARIDSSGILLIGLTATQNAGTLSGRDNDALQVKGVEGINSKATTNGGGCFIALGDSGNTSGSYFIAVDTGGSVDFRVSSSGALSKASGSFKIKHPLESKKDTHNLVHSFIEGPQADLIYRGVAVLENGTASINLDTAAGMTEGTFVLLNTNTSCFTSNESDWDAVKGSVSGNTLTISCQNTSSTATVSWLVIGERHDQHMIDTEWTDENGKVIVEPLKEQPY